MPGRTVKNSYVPSALLVLLTETPVAVFVNVTPGATAPEESRTVPTTDAVSNCAEARTAKKLSTSAMEHTRRAMAGMGTSPIQEMPNPSGVLRQTQDARFNAVVTLATSNGHPNVIRLGHDLHARRNGARHRGLRLQRICPDHASGRLHTTRRHAVDQGGRG